MDESVLRGNAGILKCHIPSFVADFVSVSAWIQDEVNELFNIELDRQLVASSSSTNTNRWYLFVYMHTISSYDFWLLMNVILRLA